MKRTDRNAALDRARAMLVQRFRYYWPLRCKASARCVPVRLPCPWCRAVRESVAELGAIDAVRAELADRAHMARLWMYIACGLNAGEAYKRALADHAAGNGDPQP
jgi:hypothetical protein